MERILIVTYNYPPSNSPGVFRILGLVNYLEEFGYTPIVLTVSHPHDGVYDGELRDFLRKEVQVFKTSNLNLDKIGIRGKRVLSYIYHKLSKQKAIWRYQRYKDAYLKECISISEKCSIFYKIVEFPDSRIGWVPSATLKAYSIVKKYNVRNVLISSPPHSSQLIGLILKHLCREIVWISDYRDPWVDNPFVKRSQLPKWLDLFERKLESHSLRRVDLIIANTKRSKENLCARHSFLDNKKIAVVTNGFDEKDFLNAKPAYFSQRKRIVCAYVGSLYSGMIDSLLNAMLKMKNGELCIAGQVQFIFAGHYDDADLVKIRINKLEDLVKFMGIVSYKRSLEVMLGADVLLYLLPADSNFGYCIPSKLYNYMATKKPILALIPDGDAAEIIRQCGLGEVIDPLDTAGIELYFSRIIKNERHLYLLYSNSHLIEQFERRTIVGKLADRLDKLRTAY